MTGVVLIIAAEENQSSECMHSVRSSIYSKPSSFLLYSPNTGTSPRAVGSNALSVFPSGLTFQTILRNKNYFQSLHIHILCATKNK